MSIGTTVDISTIFINNIDKSMFFFTKHYGNQKKPHFIRRIFQYQNSYNKLIK